MLYTEQRISSEYWLCEVLYVMEEQFMLFWKQFYNLKLSSFLESWFFQDLYMCHLFILVFFKDM